ncbi:secreted RxLR effector protein 161-like [Amaranthus tricolor]|uniref:secreted RxLR effector protein 161-like n=1 Tax=Amaranthus tricolor TaxID=29722 RepID=UPI0025906D2C|nr:secreted RxLR effector protein 161-like [Amaranthus tricolor]
MAARARLVLLPSDLRRTCVQNHCGNFALIGFSDADYAGYQVDRKSTSGSCQFLGSSLILWYSKKQNSVALSTAKVEYIVAGAYCSQILWIAQQLRDLGVDIKENQLPDKFTKPLSPDRFAHIRMELGMLNDLA